MSFLKDAISYSGINIISQFVTFVRGFIVRHILPPKIMGIWNFVQVIQGVIATFDLGTISAAGRELPILRGKKEIEEETQVRSTTFWFSFLQIIIVGLGAIIYAWWNKEEYGNWQITAFYIAAIISICNSFYISYITFFQSAQYYVLLSRLLLVISLLELISYPLGAYLGNLSGLFIAVVGAALLKVSYILKIGFRRGLRIRRNINRNILKELLSFGFPLRLVDFPNSYLRMADHLWVVKFLDIESLALYSLARVFFFRCPR